jgi:hypothetical protein
MEQVRVTPLMMMELLVYRRLRLRERRDVLWEDPQEERAFVREAASGESERATLPLPRQGDGPRFWYTQ